MSISSARKIAILGRSKDTANYEHAFRQLGACAHTTMEIGSLHEYHALLLPGGGDINPAFFGQTNHDSRNIDTELDILQFRALELFVKLKRPVLGICKGIQIINTFFGGTLNQDLPTSMHHCYQNGDQYHLTTAPPHSFLVSLYGNTFFTNSAHHQGICLPGKNLSVIQYADDNVIEGLVHTFLPIIGVQWHPERMYASKKEAVPDGSLLLAYFLSLCCF